MKLNLPGGDSEECSPEGANTIWWLAEEKRGKPVPREGTRSDLRSLLWAIGKCPPCFVGSAPGSAAGKGGAATVKTSSCSPGLYIRLEHGVEVGCCVTTAFSCHFSQFGFF